jgi:hypothetical protein
MFRTLILILAVSLAGVAQTAQVAALNAKSPRADLAVGAGDKTLESELVASEQRVADSEKNKDRETLLQTLADDFIYVAYNGLVFTKDRIVKELPYINIDQSQMENFKVRQLEPGAAILTYDLMVRGAIAGHDLPQRMYASSVWVRRSEHWILVLHQETPAHHP